MVEERPSGGSVRKRPALSDVTNRQAKRGFVPSSNDSIGLKKPDDVVGETLKENTSSGSLRVPNEIKEPSRLVKINLCFDSDEAVRQETLKKGGASKISNTPSVSKHEGDVKCSKSENSSSEIVVGGGKSKDESDEKEIVNPVAQTDVIEIDSSNEKLDTNVVGSGKSKDESDDKETDVIELDSSNEKLDTNVVGSGKSKDLSDDKETDVIELDPSNENLDANVVGSGKSKDESDDKEIVNPVVRTDVIEVDPSNEELDTNVVGNAGEGMDDDELIANKSSSSLCLEPSASSSSKNFESKTCTGFNDDGGSGSTTGLDMLKTCSCSFCLKAAHIWSDLHYQDAKGRITALKKSRKEVRSLVERSSIPADLAKYCQGNPSMKLELDLMSRWRSLFLHTEDILVRESNQLHSSLLTLKNLTENCKADLEMITEIPSNKN